MFPTPLLALLREARIPPGRLLALLVTETAIRGRLSTAGRPDLIAHLPGLAPMNLTLRNGIVEGTVALDEGGSLEFGATDALVHRVILPPSVVLKAPGMAIGDLADTPALRGARHPILGVREYADPPTTVLLFRAPRVPMPQRARARPGP